MQAMRRIVETDRRCHHGSGDVAGISGSSRRRRPRGPWRVVSLSIKA